MLYTSKHFQINILTSRTWQDQFVTIAGLTFSLTSYFMQYFVSLAQNVLLEVEICTSSYFINSFYSFKNR